MARDDGGAVDVRAGRSEQGAVLGGGVVLSDEPDVEVVQASSAECVRIAKASLTDALSELASDQPDLAHVEDAVRTALIWLPSWLERNEWTP